MATRYFGGDNLAAIGTIAAISIVLTGTLTAASVISSTLFVGNATDPTYVTDNGVNQISDTVTSTPGFFSYRDELAVEAVAKYTATTSIASFNGLDVALTVDPASTNTPDQLIGVNSAVLDEGQGIGNDIWASNFSAHNDGSARVTDLRAGNFVYSNGGTSSTAAASAVYIESPSNDGSNNNITNAYGLFIQDQNVGTNKWQLYSEGVEPSYFAGKVGIGTTTPSVPLQVQGDVTFNNATETIGGNILPSTNNTSNLGSITKAFSNLYVSSTAFITNITSKTNSSLTISMTGSPGLDVVNNQSRVALFQNTNSSAGLQDNVSMQNDAGGAVLKLRTTQSWSSGAASEILFRNGNDTVTQADIVPVGNSFLGSGSTLGVGTTAASGGSTLEVNGISQFDGKLQPNTTNSIDIGSTGLAFKGLYASGTEIILSGLGANVATDNFVCISATGTLKTETANCTVSSARFKQNINSLSPDKMLEEVNKLRAVSFDWKDSYAPTSGVNGGGVQSTGFIAEEVATIDPQLVVFETADDKSLAWEKANYPDAILYKDGKALVPKTVDYARVTYVLTGAIQAEDARITKLEQRVGILERIVHWIESFFKR